MAVCLEDSHAAAQHWVARRTPPNIPTLVQTGTVQTDPRGLPICIYHDVTQQLPARGPSFVAISLVGSFLPLFV